MSEDIAVTTRPIDCASYNDYRDECDAAEPRTREEAIRERDTALAILMRVRIEGDMSYENRMDAIEWWERECRRCEKAVEEWR